MDGSITRDEHGRITEGSILNPKGNNGHLEGWQRYGDRLQRWFALPVSEIRALAKDPVLFEALSSIDAACVTQIAGVLAGNYREREAALDRIEGKPKQTIVGGFTQTGQSGGKFTLMFATPEEEALESAAAAKKLLGAHESR